MILTWMKGVIRLNLADPVDLVPKDLVVGILDVEQHHFLG
jgi:hypothetical protein